MKLMQYDDALRAVQWELTASRLESKMDSSVLVCLCQAMVEERGLSEELRGLFLWALSSGAQMKLLEANSALFFQIGAFAGASWIWRTLLDHGYPLGGVAVQIKGASKGPSGQVRPPRVSTKLGLLCCSPYCLSVELPDLIALLVERGVDPNERDSDGYAPLGRLNEQLRQHDSNPIVEPYLPSLVRGAQMLLDKGADIDGILPVPEAFAAKPIQELIRARRDQSELLQHVPMPLVTAEVRGAPSRAL